MSTEWPKITASFTTEEMEKIDEVRFLLKTNKNKFVRACILSGIISILMERLIKNKKTGLSKVTKPIVETLFTTEIIAKLENEIQKSMQLVSHKEKEIATEEIKLLNEIQKMFQIHHPVGAPSQKKGKRGRPKDLGI